MVEGQMRSTECVFLGLRNGKKYLRPSDFLFLGVCFLFFFMCLLILLLGFCSDLCGVSGSSWEPF